MEHSSIQTADLKENSHQPIENCDAIIVSKFTVGSAAAETSLEIGDRICSINSFFPSKSEEAVRIIKQLEGMICIVAERCTTTVIEASITKTFQDEKIGIHMWDPKNDGDIIIYNFNVGGIADRTNLEIGDRICSLNGFTPRLPLEAANALKIAVGKIDIIVERYAPTVVETFVEKKIKDEKIGIWFWRNTTDRDDQGDIMLTNDTTSATNTQIWNNGMDANKRAGMLNRFFRRNASKGFDQRDWLDPSHYQLPLIT
mmetsp:Transcript_26554/g.52914  ORF Transcript_26554/g.52914 Transcript_26554/m.52914 type:complete len:257 (-) Transcript_26554:81-851(-)